MWYQKIIQVFKIRDLRSKILFVLAVFALFRLMANIPIPGINAENLKDFFNQFQMFGLLNVFTGGALDNLSIVMLGLGPYITAVIVMQLLTMIFPQLERMYKEEGEAGRQKFNQYGRLLTVPFAALQSYAMLTLFQRQNVIGELNPTILLTSILTVTAGALFLMWLGELISEKGIGNGVSLLIFAGIIADFPNNIRQMIVTWDPARIPSYLLFLGMALLIIAGVVLINEARRNIPVSYAKRVRGPRVYGGVSTYLPLSVNPAGVIPIIFALSLMLFPSMIANFLSGAGGQIGTIAKQVGVWFEDPWVHGILYFILIVLFTYFYTAVTFDPKAISTNLQKMGGFVPGIRPGQSTASFMYYILNRVLLIGALFLGTIAVMPSIVGGITGVMSFSFLIGGTSLLIVVSVVLETMRQIKAQLQMREYETF
ncbi:MAG: preprotein translocase subunit SecY [Parcubacteria group bacterium CG1_02_39_15]|uniref:Protein translocase subunit SecY n=4 Tax=Candidatus Nealsoniibacteriota TaxID=1817911 RepID=A0A2G9YTY5_9BACT|nr:MAG: preprotein translocase subunit SecY [Parcubacteria group bacterium CG1_02_39_15]PIP22203.1 MAG: preprotein translocase subunit SecY [Candidatus Nealsonbacteria bacterium CG23_combo_of_CG06-09_8_20_14_all_39_25]PIQ98282.1 MAG: preprotein translocase subunit SecY [Candidatus Nealsonbacteria bacterium CG11_big_fil_rev_8_21_14_0_20_39_9]PIW90053.1 MAG: preprotein translocase subunit SecY [Candidatus Nealsonbacteria bacterium CG_4_8_14_3_um_filter_40_11]PIZ88370.1 MAG: preprotein translocase